MRRGPLAAVVVVHLVTAAPIQAAPPGAASGPEQRYRACMDQVGSDAGKALRMAEAWRKQDGGEAALHCAAAAEMALGRFAEAGETLERLAHEGSRESPILRASLYGQAAHAWLSADRPDQAEFAATQGLALAPGDARLLVLRARARAGQQRLGEAIGDLDRVIAAAPSSAEAYVFRASALRQQKALESAAADLDQALLLDPRHPEALLERGIVRLLKGDARGARADWQALIDGDPKTPAAEQARLNLQRMDKAE